MDNRVGTQQTVKLALQYADKSRTGKLDKQTCAAFFRDLLPSVPADDIAELLDSAPVDANGDLNCNQLVDWIFVDSVQQPHGNSKQRYPSGTASIQCTEERGITLRQLDAVQAFIEGECTRQSWKDSRTCCALEPRTVNLYHLNAELIKPATRARQCSYVELVAEGAQVPEWFVSHWWGEPVLDFIACLRRHFQLRASGNNDMAYWVCAYANNQWQLSHDVGSDPNQSAFKRAMSLSVGTVTVLDKDAVTYSRIWCGFEISETLQDSTKLYDIVTAFEYEDPLEELTHAAVVITQGEAVGYRDASGLSWQHEHETNFPLDLAQRALSIRVQDAEASVENDRRHILNHIVGAAPHAEPLEEHPKYEATNAVLRGCFANATLRNAIEQGRAEGFLAAILQSCRKHIDWDFSSCEVLCDETLEQFATALPSQIEALRFHLRDCTNVSSVGLANLMWGLSALPRLSRLDLDLYGTEVGDDIFVVFAQKGAFQCLEDVTLRLTGCHGVTDLGIQHFSQMARSNNFLKSVVLRVAETQVSDQTAKDLRLTMRGKGVDCNIHVKGRV